MNGRAFELGSALPEQFGRAKSQGVTPTQALLIAYSVASDGLHPSDLGYARWAEAMWAAVERAIDERP